MAKKKEQTATVVKPKKGSRYEFQFAGGRMVGILEEKNDKLTQHYGHAWFWLRVPAEEVYNGFGKETKDMRYPVSIYNLIKEYV